MVFRLRPARHRAAARRREATLADWTMKGPRTVTIAECLGMLEQYDEILDARSPAEFALDHLPGATSAPVLDDLERAEVGTLHARQGAFASRRRGAALVVRNIGTL